MWRESAAEAFAGVELTDPVGAEALADAEQRLGRSLPSELREFLLESNGLIGRSGVDSVWPLERIVSGNINFRSDVSMRDLYMPFDPLLFFGDNGGGDQFAFVQQPDRPDIFVWEHESDSRRWVANDLRDYLRRSLAHGGDEWYE
ncbi:SMI1/KNR4 family protein [Streptomyces sp. NPDC059165]|uniref:SMI1/KNR4 family protein n=1 Tax=Streptomyces sp. NPDC059165 TaxID=3346751 RepID=UPI00369526D7